MIDPTIRQLGLCGEQMANDMRRRSGRICERKVDDAGRHEGKCASQYSKAGKRDRLIAFQARGLKP